MNSVLRNFLCLIFIALPFMAFNQHQDPSFMVSTYNVRYDAPKDTANAWAKRKEVISRQILFHKIGILGIQEGLSHQVADLDSLLPDHSYIGVGRDDGAKKGEYTAIFYNQNLFEVLDSNTFWLSTTPDKPSKSWDAALPRICTWAVLKDKHSNAVIFVFNTHFDHVGEVARVKSAQLILQKIKEIAQNNPVILMGDFNVEPETEAYKLLVQSRMEDAYQLTETPHFGPEASFNNFDFMEIPKRRIDFVFVNDYFSVLRHGILNHNYNNKYPSDHFPVVAEIKFAVD